MTRSRRRHALACLAAPALALACSGETPGPPEKVAGFVQTRPGGERVQAEIAIHPAPVDPESIPAGEAPLHDDELVLGVVADGVPVAYPIRYLALYEVVDDRVGETPLAPSW